ncbi:MAG: SBBP repeat-containing protein [Bacteroidota bacterium]
MNKLIFVLLLLFPTQTFSQTWQWAKQPIGTNINGDDHGYDIVTDVNGYSYATGKFQYTMIFGSYILTSSYDSDVYLAKYDSHGNVIWARQARGSGDDESFGVSIDNTGNVYITGYLQGVVVFENDTIFTSETSISAFIAKYDTSGSFKWVKYSSIYETNGSFGLGITNDRWGNVYTTGFYRDTIKFDSISLIGRGIFIAKFDTAGNTLWLKKISENSTNPDTYCNKITVDNFGNLFATGSFSDSIFFTSDSLIAIGKGDAFIAKFDFNGNFQWAKKMGGPNNSYLDVGYDIVSDNLGNIYSTGVFYESAIFDTINLFSYGFSDTYILKMNTSGSIIWAKHAGGTSDVCGYGLELNHDGEILITGLFRDTAIFNSNILITPGIDLFIASYDNNGNPLGAIQTYGSSSSAYCVGNSISIDTSNNAYITGIFQNSSTFGNTTLTSTGGCDIFVAKLSRKENGLIDFHQLSSFNLFPNPFHDFCTLTFNNQKKSDNTLTLFDAQGRLIRIIENIRTNQVKIERLNLKNGLYFFQLISENRIIVSGKFVIE